MKTTYFKKLRPAPMTPKIQAAVKITNNRALHCYSNSIDVDGVDGDETNEHWIEFYEGLEYIDSNKEEFDKMYIEAVGLVNELSKI